MTVGPSRFPFRAQGRIKQMATEGHDPRAVANLMLEAAEEREIALTNLALQKLLYFAHALFLVEKKKPLLSGYFVIV